MGLTNWSAHPMISQITIAETNNGKQFHEAAQGLALGVPSNPL